MAKYVIVEESWEYDDSWYFQNEGYNIKSKLYSKENLDEANAEIARLNEESKNNKYFRQEVWGDVDGDDMGGYIQPYKLVKIEE